MFIKSLLMTVGLKPQDFWHAIHVNVFYTSDFLFTVAIRDVSKICSKNC